MYWPIKGLCRLYSGQVAQEPIWASGVPKLSLLSHFTVYWKLPIELMKTRISSCNISYPMFSMSLNSLVLSWNVGNSSFSNGKPITRGNCISDDFRSVPFWRPFRAMSDGLAKVLEGRNVLTHNGTIQAMSWLRGTRAHLCVRRAQTFVFITFHGLLETNNWTNKNADFAM